MLIAESFDVFSASAPLANAARTSSVTRNGLPLLASATASQNVDGGLVERALDEPSDGVPAQRREPEPMELLVGEEPGEQLAFRAGLGRPRSDHGSDRQLVDTVREIGDEAERRAVEPVSVVEDQHRRAESFDDADGQPVQAVQDRARTAFVLTGGRRRAPEDRARPGSRPGEQVVASPGRREQRLEQLVHDAERDVLLEAPARARPIDRPPRARAARVPSRAARSCRCRPDPRRPPSRRRRPGSGRQARPSSNCSCSRSSAAIHERRGGGLTLRRS